MKKSMKKIISFALMLSLLVGMMTGISVSAAEEPTVEIVSNNVYHKEVMSLMYAVRATEGYDVAVKIYDEENTLVETITDYSVENVNGEDAMIFTSKVGVPAQDIDTEFYAVAELSKNGEVVKTSAMERYSVLEYLYERLTVSANVSDAQKTMYNNLLAFADSADIVINKDTTTNIAKYSYVRVENGTVDGTYATAMLLDGTTLDSLTTDYQVESGKVLAWNIVTETLEGGSLEEDVSNDAISDIAIEAGKAYTINAISMDAASAAIEKLATFALGANGTASHNDGSEKTSYTETNNGITLTLSSMSKVYTGARDAKGNSALKLGTSSATGKFSFTVGDNVKEVVIYVAKYKANTTKISVNGTAYTIATSSNDGQYTAITVDTSVNKTVTFETVSGGVRCMVDSIEFKGIKK